MARRKEHLADARPRQSRADVAPCLPPIARLVHAARVRPYHHGIVPGKRRRQEQPGLVEWIPRRHRQRLPALAAIPRAIDRPILENIDLAIARILGPKSGLHG